ncbi:hypothetical protein BN7_574 [Wickerhamomyces ciferrii]|uniref:Uncharacterized protein n=1 Tax=Wickerhamomyces ciferrii (strain ATCC 14091 / BCRC 22168 / CBS 111 / JCM 3599 / NBRC 0793 / NRRL Y-1031 F-60-10) TaxID=1206466 RepID=K0KFM5_WICCF|nr:uncharacterized protein BN7_574 [Wickerhamomyces ciferrii]CCH41037.1 hypothetical protein BN7_574 [Wickerhamomyces ciferrii]
MSLLHNYNLNSPLNSNPFDMDFNQQSNHNKMESKIIYKFIINHSFNLIISKYGSKFHNLNIENLNQFITILFQRLNLTLYDLQKLIIILIKYLSIIIAPLKISIKQLILGVLIKIHGKGKYNWCVISGLSMESIDNLIGMIEINDEFVKVDHEEVLELNGYMKNLIYSKFEVV